MIGINLRDMIEASQEQDAFSDAELTQIRISDVVRKPANAKEVSGVNEMVERVADAIDKFEPWSVRMDRYITEGKWQVFRSRGDRDEDLELASEHATEEAAENEASNLNREGRARAALDVLRTPSEAMRREGWAELRRHNDLQTRLGNSLVGVETPVFLAMIDAALK